MKTVLEKIAKARKIIRSTKLKKAGRNTFSNYDYFTPDQVHQLVEEACEETGLITIFSMERDEHGITGYLRVHDFDGEMYEIKMATDIPAIKATNIAQQLGGAMTYTERYLKQTSFGIVENSLDFDTTENTKKTNEQPRLPKLQVNRPGTNVPTPQWHNILKAIDDGQVKTVDDVRKHYAVDKMTEAAILIALKS